MASSKKKKTEKERKNTFFTKGVPDITLLFIIIFLILFGIIMIYSSGYYASYHKYNNHIEFLKKQLLWSSIGVFFMVTISKINYKVICSFYGLMYIFTTVCLILVLTPIGLVRNGSRRWLGVPPLVIQPSELAKLVIIITLAVAISSMQQQLKRLSVFSFIIGLLLLPTILIGKQNMSTAIVVFVIGIGMLFVSMPDNKSLFKYMIIPGGAGVGLVGGLLIFSQTVLKGIMPEYRFSRIDTFLNGPFSDPMGKGYQTVQSLYAIGSGGLFGKGLGNSMQKNGFIPEAHNDIIFSIVCEELGLFGAIIVILLFILLIWRCLVIASKTKDMLGMLLVTGVMTQIAIQVIINIAVVTNSMPVTGMPLPFISYGGSSLTFLLCEMGLVLSVSKEISLE